MKRRFLMHLLASFLVTVFVIFLYKHIPESFQSLDNRLRDFMFNYRGSIPSTGKVAIVDIDERSLKEMGQFPWGRKKIAQIIYNLAVAEVKVVGLDIVFSEEDKKSDTFIIKDRNWSVANLEEPEDYDAILGYVVQNAPTVTGYVFNMVDKTPDVFDRPTPRTNMLFSGDKLDNIPQPKGILMNVPKIQENAYSAGFFNNFSDSDGIIRRVPTLMKEDGFYYTSLAFEMYCNYVDASTVRFIYDESDLFVGMDVSNKFIPTDSAGRFFVNFRGPAKSFKYISAVDIYNNNFDPALVKDKAILIGTSAIGLLDIRTMPFDTAYPGVEVHANVIDNMLAGDFISITASSMGISMLLIISVVFFVGIITAFVPATWAFGLIALAAYGLFELLFYLHFSKYMIVNILFPFIALASMTIVSQLLSYLFENRNKRLIRAKFAQKVSPDVVDELMKDPDSVNFAGMDKEVTVFFSDVRSFTSISEKLGSAERLIQLMNDYMTPMVDIIIEEKGTIDKFIGDAIMAYWNAPKDLVGHQDAAVRAALRQLKARDELNKKLKPKYDVEISFGIGLNTGVAVVGEMGSHGRSDYTLIGDPINLGSRLEGLCKPYGVTLIISEFTKAGLKEKYVMRDLDLVQVKGKDEPVQIFEVIDFGEPQGEIKAELERYDEALHLYRSSYFKEALAIFEELKAKYDRTMYKLYVERCEHFIETPPEHFDGVFRFTTK